MHAIIPRLSITKHWLSSTLWRGWLLVSWHRPIVSSVLRLGSPRQGLSVGRLLVSLIARLRLPIRRPRVSLLVYTHCVHIPKLTSPAKRGEKSLLLDIKPNWSASLLFSSKWEILSIWETKTLMVTYCCTAIFSSKINALQDLFKTVFSETMFSNQLTQHFLVVRPVIIILDKNTIICHSIADYYQASWETFQTTSTSQNQTNRK